MLHFLTISHSQDRFAARNILADGSCFVSSPSESPVHITLKDNIHEYYPHEEGSRVWWYVPRPHLLFFYLIGHTRRLLLNPRLPRGTSSEKDADESPLLQLIPPSHSLSDPVLQIQLSVCFVGSDKVIQ